MSELTLAKAVILGVVQGLTEFLPVSSSAHLAIFERWLDLKPDSAAILLFDLATHIGTLGSLCVVFARPIGRFVYRVARESRRGWPTDRRYGWRIVWLAVVATIPTGVIGLAFKDEFEAAFDRPAWIGIELMVTGLLLLAALPTARRRGRWRGFRWWHAALVGVAQAVAILPGISRSGSTIVTAQLCGLRRQWAAQFSFLIAFPAILGAAAIMLKDTLEMPRQSLDAVPWMGIFVGTAVSFVVGALALMVLLRIIRRARLHHFAWYCLVVGGLVAAGLL